MNSKGGKDLVIVSISKASHTPQTMKRSLTSFSSDEDSMFYSSSQAKRAHLSSDSESDPVILPDTYESVDGESTGGIFISDIEHTQVATTITADHPWEPEKDGICVIEVC